MKTSIKNNSREKIHPSTLKEDLLASEIRYRRLFESAKDGILILDAETGKIIDVNPFLTNLLGFSKEEFIEKEIWEIGFFKDIASNKIKFSELQQREYVRYENLPLETIGGKKINVEFVSNVYLENRRKIIQCNIRDITERKNVEKELIKAKENAEKSDHLKTAFLANMSHEIRTPMNGILGFTELLKEPMLTGEEQQEYISIIEKSGTRMLNIINDIISISKIESGQMEITVSRINLNKLIENICALFRAEANNKNLKLEFSDRLDEHEAIINTDKHKVSAILSNIINNALKFTEKGSIEIGYRRKKDFLEFFVRDTGIGVRREQEEVIFERFRQGSESLIRNYEGAGLGLSISKGYVVMLGGKIWVESNLDMMSANKEPFNSGSTFFFTIPYVSAEIINTSLKNHDMLKTTFNPGNDLKILIAEDDKISELLISINVKKITNNILKVSTGKGAVETCLKNPDIDLILMDIKMPEMDGYEATRKIREFNKDVKIIAQTAYALNGDREKALEAGCDDYVSKPVNQAILNNILKKLFKQI